MKKVCGISSGATVAVFVAMALMGTWMLASLVVGNQARLRAMDTIPDLLTAPGEVRRSQQLPLETLTSEVSDGTSTTPWQPETAQELAVPREPTAPRDPTARDEHFKNVLEALASRQRQESFEAIFNQNEWGNPESVSGDGSTEVYTRNVRSLLAHTFTEFGIKDWIDSPCGDCNWQGLIEGIDNVSYLGLDIVPALIEGNKAKYVNRTNMNFKQQDFINEPFPHQPDLILCRDMIQHNSLVDGVRAYYNMEASGAKYLATTWHQQGELDPMVHNSNEPPGGMYFVNIFLHPFNFTKPEYFIREGGNQPDQKTLGLWKLPVLGLGDGQFWNIPDESWLKSETEIIQVKDMPEQ